MGSAPKYFVEQKLLKIERNINNAINSGSYVCMGAFVQHIRSAHDRTIISHTYQNFKNDHNIYIFLEKNEKRKVLRIA